MPAGIGAGSLPDYLQCLERAECQGNRTGVESLVDEGRLLGCIDTQTLNQIPRPEWDRHTVGELMRRELQDVAIRPTADALDALRKMQQSGFSRLLVTVGDRLIGIISLKDLLQFFSLKFELEGEDRDESATIPNAQDNEHFESELAGK